MKLYVCEAIDNAICGSDILYYLIAESGEFLGEHVCSNKWFAKGDLYERNPRRIEELTERFGECQCLFLGEDDMTRDKLLKLNKQFYGKDGNNAGQT